MAFIKADFLQQSTKSVETHTNVPAQGQHGHLHVVPTVLHVTSQRYFGGILYLHFV